MLLVEIRPDAPVSGQLRAAMRANGLHCDEVHARGLGMMKTEVWQWDTRHRAYTPALALDLHARHVELYAAPEPAPEHEKQHQEELVSAL